MDTLETKTSPSPDPNDLQAQQDALRHLVVSLLILVTVVSGTFLLYLVRDCRNASRDLNGLRPQVAQMIVLYTNQEPLFREIVRQFTEYGRTHADFAPLMAKYSLKPAAVTNVPAARPPAALPAAPKK